MMISKRYTSAWKSVECLWWETYPGGVIYVNTRGRRWLGLRQEGGVGHLSETQLTGTGAPGDLRSFRARRGIEATQWTKTFASKYAHALADFHH
jgi:hypothetical protein